MHHGSFRLFKHFAGKLSHSRSVSPMFDHFLFCICYNFGILNPCKISLHSLIFLCDSGATRLVTFFLGCCAALLDEEYVSTHFLATSTDWSFQWFFVSDIVQVLFLESLV